MPIALRRLALTALLGASAFTVAPAAASAASLTISVGADPAEDRPISMVATYGAGGPESQVFATIKPAGGLGCGDSFEEDTSPWTALFFNDDAAGSGSVETLWTFDDPGDYLVCGWLQTDRSDIDPTATSQATIRVRANAATLSLDAPDTIRPAVPFTLSYRGSSELERRVYATFKTAGGEGCAPSHRADVGTSLIYNDRVEGAFDHRESITVDEPGTYLICAWVSEESDDLQPEAAAQRVITVAADKPVVTPAPPATTISAACRRAQTKLTKTNKAAKAAKARVKQLDRRVKKAHGAKRRALKKQAGKARTAAASSARKAATARAAVRRHCA